MSEVERLEQALVEAVAKIDGTERDTPEFDAAHKEADDLRQQIHDLQQVAEHDHRSHYRQEQDWDTGVYTMTCQHQGCGETWTAPAPALSVRVGFKIEAEATVDLDRYYAELSERGRSDYLTFDLDESEYAPHERPVAFLMQRDERDLCGGIDVVPHRRLGERGQPQSVREDVRVDDWPELRVTRRPTGRTYATEWSMDDFDTLLGAVEWLRLAHEHLDAEEEPDPEDLARIPGPLDVPISFKED